MWRYLRLYAHFIRFSLGRAMTYRVDFFFMIVMDIFYYAFNFAFYKILYLKTTTLAGWNEPQIMVFIACYLVVDALNMTLFSNNAIWLPIFIQRGDLDYYLTRPVSSLFFLSVRDFAANSCIALFMAFCILGWTLHQYPEPLGFWKVVMLVGLLLNGAFLYHLVHLAMLIPVFWSHSGGGLPQLFMSLNKTMERPDRVFQGWTRVLFTMLIPFSVIASFPARLVLERFDWPIFAQLVGVTLLFTIFIKYFWEKGLKAYSSASS
ncbi:MAG: family transporter protein [Cyanobacteria bacterium RYN_339]|nr:family transporter protein [Cyanobacteria bacterium RYN_339]